MAAGGMLNAGSPVSPWHHGRRVSLFFVSFLLVTTSPLSLCLTQDGVYLLMAKHGLDDPCGALVDWNPRDSTPCNWNGIKCSDVHGGASGVTSVDMSNFNVSGPFPAALCRLPNLKYLSLHNNFINSTLPAASLLLCLSLEHLDLSENLLVGGLPSSLAILPALHHLDLSCNNLSGPIPESFGRFPCLENLTLISNFISGTIPEFITNVTSLRQLNLTGNIFSPGPLPTGIGNLTSLEILWLSGCNLTGSIPQSIENLRQLSLLDLSDNSLSGEIPKGLSNLTKLRYFDVSMNKLEGTILDVMVGLTNTEMIP